MKPLRIGQCACFVTMLYLCYGAGMPLSIAEAFRRQSEDCLRIARVTRDPRIKKELIDAAAWLHEEAARLEKLAGAGGGGPGAGTEPPKGNRSRAPLQPRSTPRYHRWTICGWAALPQ
jgi:hypothetical protein